MFTKTMKVFLFAITLAIVTHVAHAQPNDPADITKREWSHLTRTKDGRQLAYGCDRRHTYLDDGKCWAYCGADWTGGEWCYTMRNDGMTKGCKNDVGCYHFVDKCSSACSLKR